MPNAFRLIVLAFIAVAANAPLHAQEEADATAPITVKIEDVQVFDAGDGKGDARTSFGVVNLAADACYAIAPPGGASVAVGEKYAVIPATDVDDALRTKLAGAYPKCPVVDAVAREMH